MKRDEHDVYVDKLLQTKLLTDNRSLSASTAYGDEQREVQVKACLFAHSSISSLFAS